MKFEVSQRFFFDAAHTLDRKIEAEASARIHGHTYNAEVSVSGRPDSSSGMVLDLGHLRILLGSIREKLDHRMLDDIPDLGRPTLENLCAYIARSVAESGTRPSRVSIWRDGVGDRCDLLLDN